MKDPTQPLAQCPFGCFTNEGGHTDYDTLNGPDGWLCILGEPEDRTFARDASDVVDMLNRQHARIKELEEKVAELERERLDRFFPKPWSDPL